MSDKKRYLIVMVFGFFLNAVCYLLANHFGWPVWLDMTGTALAAVILEPAAGLLVGLVNSFFLCVVIFDASSMVYYSISAAAALLTGLLLKKQGRIAAARIPLVMILMILVTGFLSGTLTLWHGGVSTSLVEQLYYERMMATGMAPVLACYATAWLIKTYDVVASSALFAAAYLLLPGKLKEKAE